MGHTVAGPEVTGLKADGHGAHAWGLPDVPVGEDPRPEGDGEEGRRHLVPKTEDPWSPPVLLFRLTGIIPIRWANGRRLRGLKGSAT